MALKRLLKWTCKIMAISLPLFFLLILGSIVIIIGSSKGNGDTSNINIGSAKVSQAVLAWAPDVESAANQYGMTQYVPLLLALMQQESGGTVPDVMQAAEGPYNTEYPKVPNGIPDPDYSISCGVQELKGCLDKAGVKDANDITGISLALQAYNFGDGFIDYAKSHGGYSQEVAQDFSIMEATENGWSSYGDPQYVQHVLQYYSIQK